jgi:hypothetical protein
LFAFDPATRDNVGMFRVRVRLKLERSDQLVATFAAGHLIDHDGTVTGLGGGPDAYACTRMQVLPTP